MSNGFLDQKRSELEVKRTEISIQNVKLQLEQHDLIARRDTINAQIAQNEAALSAKTTELKSTQEQLRQTKTRLAEAETNLSAYVTHEWAVAFLTGHKRSIGAKGLACEVAIDATDNNVAVKIIGEGLVDPKDQENVFAAIKDLHSLEVPQRKRH